MANTKFYLQLDGVMGWSKDWGHIGWIELLLVHVSPAAYRKKALTCIGLLGPQSSTMAIHHSGSDIPKGTVEAFTETSGKMLIAWRARLTDIEVVSYQTGRGNSSDMVHEAYRLECADIDTEFGNALLASQLLIRPTLWPLLRSALNR